MQNNKEFKLVLVEDLLCDSCHKMKSVNVYRLSAMGGYHYLHICSKCLPTFGKKWGINANL